MNPIVFVFPWEPGWKLGISFENPVNATMWDYGQAAWLAGATQGTMTAYQETGLRSGSYAFRWTPPAGAFVPNASYIARVHDMDKLAAGRPSVVAVIDFTYRG